MEKRVLKIYAREIIRGLKHLAHLFDGLHLEMLPGNELVKRAQVQDGAQVAGFLRYGEQSGKKTDCASLFDGLFG